MSQVIAVVSGKGGTGKTSFTALTGMALSRLGMKTLLLDCDVGLRNLDLYLGMSDCALMDFTSTCSPRPSAPARCPDARRCAACLTRSAPASTSA